MSDLRQELIDAIDALTPEQQRRMLELLRSLASGETGADTPSAHGDGAIHQPPETGSNVENRDDEPSKEDINRKVAALDSFIGGVSHGALAQDIDEELYGK